MQADVLAQYSQAAESQCNTDKVKVEMTSMKKTYLRYQKEFAEFCHVLHGDDREAVEMTMEKVYGFLFYHAYRPAYPNHGGEKGKKWKGDKADLDGPLVMNMDNNTTEGITTTAITDSTNTDRIAQQHGCAFLLDPRDEKQTPWVLQEHDYFSVAFVFRVVCTTTPVDVTTDLAIPKEPTTEDKFWRLIKCIEQRWVDEEAGSQFQEQVKWVRGMWKRLMELKGWMKPQNTYA